MQERKERQPKAGVISRQSRSTSYLPVAQAAFNNGDKGVWLALVNGYE